MKFLFLLIFILLSEFETKYGDSGGNDNFPSSISSLTIIAAIDNAPVAPGEL